MKASTDIARLLDVRHRREAVAEERLAAARLREQALSDGVTALEHESTDLERRIRETSPLGRMRSGVRIRGALLQEAAGTARSLAAERAALLTRRAELLGDLAAARNDVDLRAAEALEARRRALRTELLAGETKAIERRARDRAAERAEQRVGDQHNARRR